MCFFLTHIIKYTSQFALEFGLFTNNIVLEKLHHCIAFPTINYQYISKLSRESGVF